MLAGVIIKAVQPKPKLMNGPESSMTPEQQELLKQYKDLIREQVCIFLSCLFCLFYYVLSTNIFINKTFPFVFYHNSSIPFALLKNIYSIHF